VIAGRLLVGAIFAPLMLAGCQLPHVPLLPNSPTAVLPQQTASTITVPVTVTFDPASIRDQAEATVPHLDYHGDAVDSAYVDLGSNFFLKYIAWRDVISITFQPDSLRATTAAYFWAEVLKNHWGQFGGTHIAGCGKDEADGPRIVDLGITTKFKWTPTWQFQPTSTFYAPSFRNPCKWTFVGVDVNPVIADKLGNLFNSLGKQVDATIAAKTNFGPKVTTAWSAMNATQKLEDNVWLNMHPTSLAVAPIIVDTLTGTVTSAVVLTASPEVTIGGKPPDDSGPVPAPVEAHPSSDMHIYGRVIVDFDALSGLVGQNLGLPRKTDISGHSATISGVSFYPSNGNLVVVVKLARPKGAIYLQGTPVYSGDTLKITNADFTLATKNLLAKGFDWLLHNDIRDLMLTAINTMLSQQFSAQRDIVTLKLKLAANRDLSAHVKLRTEGVHLAFGTAPFLTAQAIVLPIELDGTSLLLISP
jgi:hypothetical protein